MDDGTLYPHDPRQAWGNTRPPVGVVRAATFAYPLVEITSRDVLEKKIVKPVLASIT
jgi:hypothetical protein